MIYTYPAFAMRIDDPILLGLLYDGLINSRVSLLLLVNLGQLNSWDGDQDSTLLGQVVTLKRKVMLSKMVLLIADVKF